MVTPRLSWLGWIATVLAAALPAPAQESGLSPVVNGISIVVDVDTGAQVDSIQPNTPFQVHVVINELSGFFMSACQFGVEVDPRLLIIERTPHADVSFLEELVPGDFFLGWGNRLDLLQGPHVLLTLGLILPGSEAPATDLAIRLRPHTSGEPMRWAEWPHTWFIHDLIDAGGVVLDPSQPGIITFSTSRPFLVEGRDLLVHWATHGSQLVLLDGSPVEIRGSRVFSPTEDTTYSLTVDPEGAALTEQAQVVVIREPQVSRFFAEPPAPESGEIVRVRWSTLGANELTLYPPGISVGAETGYEFHYQQRTSFALVASNEWGNTQAFLNIGGPGPPVIGEFSSSSHEIDLGQEILLSWAVGGSDRVVLEPAGIEVEEVGQLSVRPQDSTTYRLTASNDDGATQESIFVKVHPMRIEHFSVTPTRVFPYEPIQLSWSTINADSTWIEPGIGHVSSLGSIELPTTPDSTTYELFASNNKGLVLSEAILASWKLPIASLVGPPLRELRLGSPYRIEFATAGADSARVTPGTDWLPGRHLDGHRNFILDEPRTHVLEAVNAKATVTREYTATPWPPHARLLVTQHPPGEGGIAVLEARVARSTDVIITPGDFTYSLPWQTGFDIREFRIALDQTTSFKIDVSTAFGSASDEATAFVGIPTVGLEAVPEHPPRGEPFTLLVLVSNAAEARLNPGQILLAPQDTTLTRTIHQTTNFILTATSPAGTASDTLTVEPEDAVSNAFRNIELTRLSTAGAPQLRYRVDSWSPPDRLEIWRGTDTRPLEVYASLPVHESMVQSGDWTDPSHPTTRTRYRLRAHVGSAAAWSTDVWFEAARAFEHQILGNMPNPFNPSTTIRFEVAQAGAVGISVFTAAGRRVRHVSFLTRNAGPNAWHWDGRDDRGLPVGSGVYLVRLKAGADEDVHRMTLMK